jgi:serine palmitoyltransferase
MLAGLERRRHFVAPPGYAPLVNDFAYFFTRRVYTPQRDCWDRPIDSCPGALIDVMERSSPDDNETYVYTGRKQRCINLGSCAAVWLCGVAAVWLCGADAAACGGRCGCVVRTLRLRGRCGAAAWTLRLGSGHRGSASGTRCTERRPTAPLARARYNYLGFAETHGPVTDHVLASLPQYGASTCSARTQFGTTAVHRALELQIARFVSKEDAVVFNMGFATNSTVLPALVGPGDLVISDALNHASVVFGCRSSGAKITIFKHNHAEHLERVLHQAIAEGQPRTHLPWNKILVVVEGIYSMEGEVCALRDIVHVKVRAGVCAGVRADGRAAAAAAVAVAAAAAAAVAVAAAAAASRQC